MYQVRSLLVRCGAAFAVVLALASLSVKPAMAQGQDEPGAVYVLSNQNPNSVLVYARAANGTLVYIVNGSGTIQGLTFDPVSGHLSAISGSLQPLPGGASAGPGQIGISPDGAVLIVTEKSTNTIDTWQINSQGAAVNGTT